MKLGPGLVLQCYNLYSKCDFIPVAAVAGNTDCFGPSCSVKGGKGKIYINYKARIYQSDRTTYVRIRSKRQRI